MKKRVQITVTTIDSNYKEISKHNFYFFWKGMGLRSFTSNVVTLLKEIKRLCK